MKNSLLTLVAFLGLTSGTMAQSMRLDIPSAQKNIQESSNTYVLKNKTLVPTRRASVYSNWYNFTGAYEEGTLLGQKLNRFVNFIMPDTNLYTVYSDGTKSKTGFHVIGSTFDPKDSNFLAVGNEVLYRYNPYTVDSLAFTQFYVRQIDKVKKGAVLVDVVDTVYIQYFNIAGIKVGGYTFTANPGVTYKYAVPTEANFSTKSLLNSAAIRTDTILLTKALADSVVLDPANGVPKSFIGRGIQIPVNVKSQSTNGANGTANLFAFTIVYKPMVKPNLGDTGMAYDGSKWTKKYNLYGLSLASATGVSQEILTTNKINNMFVTNFQVRYGQTLFGFLKSYLPGTIWTNSLFFPNFLKITTPNLSTEKMGVALSGLKVYPNPMASGNKADVLFNLSINSNVAVTITDMNGRVVSKIVAKPFMVGQNGMSISTDGLSKGVYMVTLESGAGSMSSKLTVN